MHSCVLIRENRLVKLKRSTEAPFIEKHVEGECDRVPGSLCEHETNVLLFNRQTTADRLSLLVKISFYHDAVCVEAAPLGRRQIFWNDTC